MKKWLILLISLIIAVAFLVFAFNALYSGSVPSEAEPIMESTALADLLYSSFDSVSSIGEEPSSVSSADSEIKEGISSITDDASSELNSVTESPVPTPSPTAVPTATPTTAPTATPSETSAPEVTASSSDTINPVINIENALLPGTVTINSPVNLGGTITTDKGKITHVYAVIENSEGLKSQYCDYAPYSSSFSLAGTVNADLHFYQLGVGTYIYRVTVTVTDNESEYEETIIEQNFEVVPAGSVKSEQENGGAGGYVAKVSNGTDNQSIIWDFFIQKFDNPYAVAGIMANIQAESSFDPGANQGEYTGDAHGYGLCQWTWERKDNLKKFAEERGTEVNDLNMQLEFIMYELDTTYPTLKQFLYNVTDGSTAAIQFCKIYEESASSSKRGSYAETYLNKFALP